MIADREFTYRSVELKAGERFDCDDEHVSVFEVIGFAHVPRSQAYSTRVMEADTTSRRRRKAETA
jgi:hypothetical protein